MTEKEARAEAEKMLIRAKEAGINYFDTAYPYHDGDSEPLLGRVLEKFDRKSYYLATKLPVWKVHSVSDAVKIFDEQLARLNKDYIDFYLLHALDKDRFKSMCEIGVIDWIKGLKEKGIIRHMGFSFHDDYETFEKILTYTDWDFCQIQYNYMDRDYQAGDKGYELAKSMGIPMVIMEPVRGGLLAGFSDEINNMFPKGGSVASYALRWVASHDNVMTVLSGMSTMEQLEDNIATFSDFKPLNKDEDLAVQTVADTLKARTQNKCTACRYCMPCPAGVDIPENFRMWNMYHIYQNEAAMKGRWKGMDASKKALSCVKCGKCESVCPQHISIRDDLSKLQKEFDALVGE